MIESTEREAIIACKLGLTPAVVEAAIREHTLRETARQYGQESLIMGRLAARWGISGTRNEESVP